MLPELQREVNSRITPEAYQQLRQNLDSWLDMTIQYRVAEMPIMVSAEFAAAMQKAAVEIITECVKSEAERPLFSVVDFAVCQDEAGVYIPRLIELQGFPSLFGYQVLLCDMYKQTYGINEGTPFLSGLDHASYMQLLRQSIFADADPAACVLLEIDPFEQKTLPDFLALRKYLGLNIVNIRDVRKVGNQLHAPVNGTMTRLERIFNRAIVDELTDMGVVLDFDWNDDLDVQWAGKPEWYFKISKDSMPGLSHPTVPKSSLLSDITEPPTNLESYVLKPLYAFAGKGVVVGPTQADLDAIAQADKSAWMLQERVTYADCVPTPQGANRVEIRIMLVWLEGAKAPVPVISLARTGRGLLMGARYNTIEWTGSSGCLFC